MYQVGTCTLQDVYYGWYLYRLSFVKRWWFKTSKQKTFIHYRPCCTVPASESSGKKTNLETFSYLKIPMCYVVIWGKVVAQTKLHQVCGLECSDTTDTTKKFETPTPLKKIQLWLSYTLQNLHDILDLWPAKHSLKPSEKHRFLNAAATSFAVETSFANFKWHSHQLHFGWVGETSSNAFFEWTSLSSKHCANLNPNVYKLKFSHCKFALKLQVELDPPLPFFCK